MKKLSTLSILSLIVMLLAITTACQKKPAETAAGQTDDAVAGDTVRSSDPNSDNVIQYSGIPLARIHFGFDQANLSSNTQRIIRDNLEVLKSQNASTLTLEGHCDARGSDEYNQSLGQRRAESVRSYLKSLGYNGSVETVSYGELQPLDNASNEQAWALNRRVEFMAR